jgi:hypothetical protein
MLDRDCKLRITPQVTMKSSGARVASSEGSASSQNVGYADRSTFVSEVLQKEMQT